MLRSLVVHHEKKRLSPSFRQHQEGEYFPRRREEGQTLWEPAPDTAHAASMPLRIRQRQALQFTRVGHTHVQQIMRVKCFRRASSSAIVGQRLRKSHGRCPARPQGDMRCLFAEGFAELSTVAQLRRRPCARHTPAELDRRALGAEPRSFESEAHLHRLAGRMATYGVAVADS